MSTSDLSVGETLARLRGAMPQAELARLMRARNWKWSQATVTSVETGMRSLKLLEAAALAEVLHCDVAEFVASEETRAIAGTRAQLAEIRERERRITVAVWDLEGLQLGLVLNLRTLDEAGALAAVDAAEAVECLQLDPGDVVSAAWESEGNTYGPRAKETVHREAGAVIEDLGLSKLAEEQGVEHILVETMTPDEADGEGSGS